MVVVVVGWVGEKFNGGFRFGIYVYLSVAVGEGKSWRLGKRVCGARKDFSGLFARFFGSACSLECLW